MTEGEMVKELKRIIEIVSAQDRIAGNAVGSMLQVRADVRAELVSAVREKWQSYLVPAA